MLAEITKRYDHSEISTDQFRQLAAHRYPDFELRQVAD